MDLFFHWPIYFYIKYKKKYLSAEIQTIELLADSSPWAVIPFRKQTC
jgi:hypothetical protein